MLPTSFATFIGRNSVPQFLACSLAGVAGLLTMYASYRKKSTSDRRYQIKYPSVNLFAKARRRIDDFVSDVDVISAVCLVAMIIIAISILVANSRGGILANATSGFVTAAVFLLGRKVSTSAIAGLLILVVASAAFLSFYGLDEAIGKRFDSLSEEAYRVDNARLHLWGLVLSQPGCWKLGSGLGTFHFSLLPFYDSAQPYWWYHAENIFFELLSNQGIWVLLIAVAGGLALLRQLLVGAKSKSLKSVARLVCLYAFLAVMLQSLVDFSLILPAVFVPLATIVGAFWGASTKPVISPRTKEKSGASRSSSRGRKREPNKVKARSSTRAQHRKRNVSAAEKKPNQEDASVVEQANSLASMGRNGPLVLQIAIVLIVIALGFGPLRSFAEAERLAKVSVSDAEVDENMQMQFLLEDSNFPETRFQRGRIRQSFAEGILRIAPIWPEGISDTQRAALSKPEMVTAAFRMESDPQLVELKQLVERVPAVITGLDESADDMSAALVGCALDWRANWGLLRSEMGRLTDSELDALYARILITCRSNPAVLQAAGTHALVVEHAAAGLHFWREVLPGRGQARAALVGLVGRLITPQQMMDILPADPWIRLNIAESFEKAQKQDVASLILKSVEIEPLFEEQSNRLANWLSLAWVAARSGNIDQELEALHEAVLAAPSNIGLIVRYADTLARAGKISEAIDEMRQVVARYPENSTYRQKLDELREKQ